jgi:hypothetical protein
MPIYVRAMDGSLHSFPDGTSRGIIAMAMQSYDRRQGDLASLAALPLDAVRGVLMGLPIQKKWAEIAYEQDKVTYDNDIDAQRHAEWHQKMAQTFGPRNAVRVGDLYEDVSRIGGPWVGKPYKPAADRMDR